MASASAQTGEDAVPFDPNEDIPQLEEELGMGFYLTGTPGIGGRLRQRPEDFQVQEDSAPAARAREGGKYTLARVEARNWETNRLIREIANRVGIPQRAIYFTGTKDKRAVTVQNLAIAAPEEKVADLSIPDVEILETYRVDRAPKLGEHVGNAFTIKIRGLEHDIDTVADRVHAVRETVLDAGGFPNFFGPQRFGSVHPITHRVGRAIVRGRFEEAVWTYVAFPSEYDDAELDELRSELWAKRDVHEARERLPKRFDNEHRMLDHLADRPDDAKGALTELPLNLTRLFVSAHQSHIFNQTLTRRARVAHPAVPHVGDVLHPIDADGLPDPDRWIPVRADNLDRCREVCADGHGVPTALLPGFAFEEQVADGLQGRIEREALEDVGTRPDDFRVVDLPKLSSRGTRRAMWCPIDHLPVTVDEDESGSYVECRFFLPKGSYATCLLREFMKMDPRSY